MNMPMSLGDDRAIEWRRSPDPIEYADALAIMDARSAAIRTGTASELVWLLEHPPIYTAGTSAAPNELLDAHRFPVHHTGRGGRYTYHGPGQRIGYVLIDLEKRGRDVRRYVQALEHWMIDALSELGVAARQEPGRIGIWVGKGTDEAKIGAIGVRVRRWVTLHGFSINVAPDLSHFSSIIPCGIADFGVTSLAKLGISNAYTRLDAALEQHFAKFLANI